MTPEETRQERRAHAAISAVARFAENPAMKLDRDDLTLIKHDYESGCIADEHAVLGMLIGMLEITFERIDDVAKEVDGI